MDTSEPKEFKLPMRCMDRHRNIYNLVDIHTWVSLPDLSDIDREIREELSALPIASSPTDELPASLREKLDYVHEQISMATSTHEYFYEGERVRRRPDGSFEIPVDGEYVIVREIPPSEFYNELMGRYSPFKD